MINLTPFVLFFIAFFAPSSIYASPYSTVLEGSKIKDKFIQNQLNNVTVPEKDEVPIPAYENASITKTATISSSADGMLQENTIMYLASTDSPEKIVDFYKNTLPKWKFESLKTYDLFLKEGDQLFWGGGKTLLKAPRIQIHNLEKLDGEFDPAIIKLKQQLPELKTLIKLFYEKSIGKQRALDMTSLISSCVTDEIKSQKESFKGPSINPSLEKFFKNNAEAFCKRIKKSCDKDQNSVRCQKAIKKYK